MKRCTERCVLQLYQSSSKVSVGIGTKDKPLVRTENSSSVNVWSGMLCIFLLY